MTTRPIHRQIGTPKMAAQLSLASATVTDDEDQQVGGKDAPVLVRGNTLRIGAGNGATVFEDVQTVTQVGRGVWEITLPTTRVLTVRRAAGCGCRK